MIGILIESYHRISFASHFSESPSVVEMIEKLDSSLILGVPPHLEIAPGVHQQVVHLFLNIWDAQKTTRNESADNASTLSSSNTQLCSCLCPGRSPSSWLKPNRHRQNWQNSEIISGASSLPLPSMREVPATDHQPLEVSIHPQKYLQISTNVYINILCCKKTLSIQNMWKETSTDASTLQTSSGELKSELPPPPSAMVCLLPGPPL